MASASQIRSLAAGFSAEVDCVDEREWCETLAQFDDANIYQTWPYGVVVTGPRSVSRLAVKLNGEVVALAQCRIKRVPILGVGIAYVQWGPVWRKTGTEMNGEIFRQAVRALHNEYVGRRGLTLRVFPIEFTDGGSEVNGTLTEEGLAPMEQASRSQTILMNLRPAVAELREGMRAHWKRELKVAEKGSLDFVAGTSADLFAEFIGTYKEMVARKKFVEPNDIFQFQRIQEMLPEAQKMRVLLCRVGGELAAGAIYSAIGNSAIYLFGATSNAGMKSRGSYLLQWRIVQELKERGTAIYNLNGINAEKNPGTYKFKSDLAGIHGTEVLYLGRFDAHAGSLTRSVIQLGDAVRNGRRKLQQRMVEAKGTKAEKQEKAASATEQAPARGQQSAKPVQKREETVRLTNA
jgi:hypothetical protein